MIAALVIALASVVPGCWRPPVDAPVARPFVAPACVWCPGHRGIEYAVDGSAQVTAVATGTVTYAGIVAGTRYVVVGLADGRKVTYGSLASIAVRTGQRVVSGSLLGRVVHRLFLGLRVGGVPVDPAPLLCHRGHVRLVPSQRVDDRVVRRSAVV